MPPMLMEKGLFHNMHSKMNDILPDILQVSMIEVIKSDTKAFLNKNPGWA